MNWWDKLFGSIIIFGPTDHLKKLAEKIAGKSK